MRTVYCSAVKNTVKRLILEASYRIGPDVERAVACALESEPSPVGRSTLSQILENYDIARQDSVAICQDTGMAVVFAGVGQDVHFEGGSFQKAIDDGVREAYEEGYLRKSVVTDPLFDRLNTKTNLPAVVYTDITEGDKVKLLITLKGFGSENMSAIKMLTPADGVEGVERFVAETVINAGPNPCPPVIVGVGIGGTMDKAALLAKKATARAVDVHSPDPRYRELEQRILDRINRSGVGPGGTGGRTTALAVHIDWYPTHIAGLPVAVNICCHAARHASAEL